MPWPLLTSYRPLQILPRQTERCDCLEFEFSTFQTMLLFLNVFCLKSYYFNLCWPPPPSPTHPPVNPETIMSYDISLLCVFKHFLFPGTGSLAQGKAAAAPTVTTHEKKSLGKRLESQLWVVNFSREKYKHITCFLWLTKHGKHRSWTQENCPDLNN